MNEIQKTYLNALLNRAPEDLTSLKTLVLTCDSVDEFIQILKDSKLTAPETIIEPLISFTEIVVAYKLKRSSAKLSLNLKAIDREVLLDVLENIQDYIRLGGIPSNNLLDSFSESGF